jgi:hypothetical protein
MATLFLVKWKSVAVTTELEVKQILKNASSLLIAFGKKTVLVPHVVTPNLGSSISVNFNQRSATNHLSVEQLHMFFS